MQDDFMDPRLVEDIAIFRRELAEGKGIPHEVVFAELDKKLRELKATLKNNLNTFHELR